MNHWCYLVYRANSKPISICVLFCMHKLVFSNVIMLLQLSIQVAISCHLLWHFLNRISLLLHESKGEPRTNVNNKDILRVLWGLTDFYPSALIYHVFYQNYVLECM